MRYRRYYTHRTRDGSRTVISHDAAFGLVRVFLPLVLVALIIEAAKAIGHGIKIHPWASGLALALDVVLLMAAFTVNASERASANASNKGMGIVVFGLVLIVSSIVQQPWLVPPTLFVMGLLLASAVFKVRTRSQGEPSLR
jgi:hypothetical protein